MLRWRSWALVPFAVFSTSVWSDGPAHSRGALATAAGVSVKAAPQYSPQRPPNSGPYTATFWVKNTTAVSRTFTFDCSTSWSPPITCTNLNKTSATIAAGDSTSVIATYTVGSYAGNANGYVSLSAENTSPTPGAVGSGSQYVPVGTSGVIAAVSPDAGSVNRDTYTSYTQTFIVWNLSTWPVTYSVTPSCTGAAVNPACTADKSSVALGEAGTSSDSALVTVFYWSQANGTSGKLALYAQESGITRDSGWVNVTVGSTGGTPVAPTVSLVELNSGTTQARGLCLTVSLGPSAASECGDLRLTHGLQTLKTLGVARTPVLLYGSQTAEPAGLVVAEVTMPTGSQFPDWVEAILRVDGIKRDSVRFAGNEWTAGRPRRIMVRDTTVGLTEGIHTYSLEVATLYGAARYAASAANGSFTIVNRRTSPYGMGWWPAGLEKLNVATMLWIGGDGSTRLYQPTTDPNKWVGPNVDRPDTLQKSGTEYWRWLPEKGKVVFDATGRHIRTENRLGYATRFVYDGSGRLDSIVAPIPTGGVKRAWKFTYGSNLVTISDGIGASPRLVKLHLGAGRVDSIVDPDTTKIRFGYAGASSGLVTSRTDRRGYARTFTLDAFRHVTGMSVDPGYSQAMINLLVRPLESQGFVCGASPCSVDMAVAYTLVNGPRTDVGDSTVYFLNRFGSPKQVVSALGDTTKLQRDTQWPALVTRMAAPNGQVVKASYNSRGNVLSVTDSTATVKGSTTAVTTSYQWDVNCPDMVSQISPPGILPQQFGYDATTCNRLWEKNGNNDTVSYTYHTASKLLATIRTPGITSVDSLLYTAQGNLQATRTPMGFRTELVQDAYGRDSVVWTPTDSAQTQGLRQKAVTLYYKNGLVWKTDVIGAATSYWNPTGAGSTVPVPGVTTTTEFTRDGEGNLTQTMTTTNPDSTGVATRSNASYDYAGRPRTKRAGGATREYTYDPASNVIAERSYPGRNLTVAMTYDALNRLIRRVTPQVDYAQTACTPGTIDCRWVFPYYPNNGTGLRIYADTAVFAYDVAGNMIQADNRDAQIRRTYTKSGWLATDSLWLRSYGSTSFTTHRWGLTIRYDSLGRRRSLRHPSNLYNHDNVSTRDSVVYIYHAATGALQEVRDLVNRSYTYTDDAAGRQVKLEARNAVGGAVGVKDSTKFDPDGRVLERKVYLAGSGSPSITSSFRYDARGKLRFVNYSGLDPDLAQTDSMYYAGHGPLVAALRTFTYPSPDQRLEEFRVDGLANTYYSRTTGEPGNPVPMHHRTEFEDLSGRLIRKVALEPSTLFNGAAYPDTVEHTYDGAGNLSYRWRHAYSYGPLYAQSWENERHYYGADEKLRYVQRTVIGAFDLAAPGWLGAPAAGSWQEYWYDALGRRVLMRERRMQLSTQTYRRDVLDRFVWDGDQLLYEIRIPGGASNNLNATGYNLNRFHGTVGYIHGRELDAPLALTDTDGRIGIQDFRGMYEGSVKAAGGGADCKTNNYATGCWNIAWPAKNGVNRQGWGPQEDIPDEWRGSLLWDQADKSGMVYRRNRYYDPQTGRFTQVDPIGIAGGLNVYGFANGDPVNYSDPFGLSPLGIFAKTVKKLFKRVSREQALKTTDDLYVVGRGSSGDAKKLADEKWGEKATRHDAHQEGQLPHYQHTNGGRGHIFYLDKLGTIGVALLGDNLLGQAVDFFNPAADALAVVQLIETAKDEVRKRKTAKEEQKQDEKQ